MGFKFEKFGDNGLVLWNNTTESSVNAEDLDISEDKLREYLKENPMPKEDNYFENDLIHDLTNSTGAFLIPDELHIETIEFIEDLIDNRNPLNMDLKIGLIKKAKLIATEGHKTQKRWNGEPYITHPEAVAKLVNTPEQKIVAWLHDIIEDTKITAEYLLNEGIPADLVEMIEIMSRKKGDYFDYIMRCNYHKITRKVKIADLTHNLSDLKKGNMRDKYLFARYVLMVDDE